MDSLPKALILHALKFMPLKQRFVSACLCKRFRDIVYQTKIRQERIHWPSPEASSGRLAPLVEILEVQLEDLLVTPKNCFDRFVDRVLGGTPTMLRTQQSLMHFTGLEELFVQTWKWGSLEGVEFQNEAVMIERLKPLLESNQDSLLRLSLGIGVCAEISLCNLIQDLKFPEVWLVGCCINVDWDDSVLEKLTLESIEKAFPNLEALDLILYASDENDDSVLWNIRAREIATIIFGHLGNVTLPFELTVYKL